MAISPPTRHKWAVIFICAFFICAGVIVWLGLEYQRSLQIYADSQSAFQVQQAAPETADNAAAALAEPVLAVDFASLQRQNQQVKAWLWIPGTDISYPVVQGTDNEEYLHYSYDQQRSVNGSIFIDSRNETPFNELNTIIYGHNMKNGSMFGSLYEFRDQQFAQEHTYIYIVTPERQYKYQIFSAYVGSYNGNAYVVQLADGNDAQLFAEQLIGKSEVMLEGRPLAGDQLLTLSTCTIFGSRKRMIVHAYLVQSEPLTTDATQ